MINGKCLFVSNIYIAVSILILIPSIVLSQAISTADSTSQFKSSLNAYPYAYYTPETQLAFGAGGVYTFYTKKDSELNPSNFTLSGYYATVKTYQFSLQSNIFFDRNRMAFYFDVVYGHYVERFYGVGNDTPDFEDKAEYVLDNVGGILDFEVPPLVFISNRAGIVFEYRDYSIVDAKENPYLQSDSIPGSTGGVISGLGVVYVWDTRDHVFFPNGGGLTKTTFLIYVKGLGSDYKFTWFEVNGRHYWAFAPDHVLAWQIYASVTEGDVPFFKLPALGGARLMRGYFYGRFRDNKYFTTQFEYRQYFWKRFGFVAFAGIGDVAEKMTDFSLKRFKPTYGIGLRYLFSKEEKINLRVDLGFGRDTNGIYFGIEEAF